MGKKETENRYGVQVGDVFAEKSDYEDGTGLGFYQVVRLKGETQVVLKQIDSLCTAFDLHAYVKVPVYDSWTNGEEMVRKIGIWERTDPETELTKREIWVNISQSRGFGVPYAYLYDKSQRYIGSEGFLYPFQDEICREFPAIEQFELSEGSGIFAENKPFGRFYDNCPVIIRYPDGREERNNLKNMFNIDKIRQEHSISYKL